MQSDRGHDPPPIRHRSCGRSDSLDAARLDADARSALVAMASAYTERVA